MFLRKKIDDALEATLFVEKQKKNEVEIIRRKKIGIVTLEVIRFAQSYQRGALSGWLKSKEHYLILLRFGVDLPR